MNLPNKLTIFRVILIPFFLMALLGQVFDRYMSNYVAVAIFCVASLTDWLDGYLARKYKLVTNFGKFMDPMADKLLVCSALIAMIELGYLPAWVVILIIGREFIISAFRLVAADNNVVIAAGKWGKVKTAVTMIMIIFVLLDIPNTRAVSNILIGLSVAFTVISAFEYIYGNRNVLKQIGS